MAAPKTKTPEPAPAAAPQPKPATTPVPDKDKPVAYPLKGEVAAVTPTVLTIKGGAGKPDRVYTITPETKIVNGEKPATIADVKVGQNVGGRLEKSANGKDKVLKINIGVKQPDKAKGK
jgi:hypothetical protein